MRAQRTRSLLRRDLATTSFAGVMLDGEEATEQEQIVTECGFCTLFMGSRGLENFSIIAPKGQ